MIIIIICIIIIIVIVIVPDNPKPYNWGLSEWTTILRQTNIL